MADKTFIEGVFVKTITTQYGDIQKLSFDMEKFIEFARKHAQKSEKNGKHYLNTDLLVLYILKLIFYCVTHP